MAMATPREGRWAARAENNLEAGLGTVHATLEERIIERGARSPGRGSAPRGLWFVDERVSRVSLTFNGLDFAAEMRELESKLAGTVGPSQLPSLLESPGLASIPGLTHTPAEQAAAREAVLAYFAEERPDLVDRLRRGEAERVIDRSSVSSRQAFWAGLGAAAILGALAWRRAGRLTG